MPKDNECNSWLTAYPVHGGPDYDDEGDGWTNDFERLFGQNPTEPVSAYPYTAPFDKATGGISYSRRTRGLTGWTYKVWYSMNLVDWFEDTLAQQDPLGPVNDIEIVDVLIDPALLSEPKLFVQTVTGASLSPDGKTVTLTLAAALSLDTPYTVKAHNLTGSNGGVSNPTTGTSMGKAISSSARLWATTW